MKGIIALIRGQFFRLVCRYSGGRIVIGRNLRLFCSLEIRGNGKVSIGENCGVAGVIGDKRHYVTLYTHSPEAIISIGDNARLYAARMSSKFEISIGDDFVIEDAGIMDTDFHSLEPERGDPQESAERCRVQIGSRVSVGARSVVCKGL